MGREQGPPIGGEDAVQVASDRRETDFVVLTRPVLVAQLDEDGRKIGDGHGFRRQDGGLELAVRTPHGLVRLQVFDEDARPERPRPRLCVVNADPKPRRTTRREEMLDL